MIDYIIINPDDLMKFGGADDIIHKCVPHVKLSDLKEFQGKDFLRVCIQRALKAKIYKGDKKCLE